MAIGEHVLDLAPLAAEENLDGAHVFAQPSLNRFMSMGPQAWAAVRGWLRELVGEEPHRSLVEPHLIPLTDVQLHMPFEVADFVDFYASQQHAENVGRIFRPDSPALAWRLAAAADRLPRPVGNGRPVRDRHRPAMRLADRRRRGRLWPVSQIGHRSRGRLRRRSAVDDGTSGAGRAIRRARLRRRPRERLVGPRHPGVRIRPTRPVSRQVLRDVDLVLGGATRRTRRRAGRAAGP